MLLIPDKLDHAARSGSNSCLQALLGLTQSQHPAPVCIHRIILRCELNMLRCKRDRQSSSNPQGKLCPGEEHRLQCWDFVLLPLESPSKFEVRGPKLQLATGSPLLSASASQNNKDNAPKRCSTAKCCLSAQGKSYCKLWPHSRLHKATPAGLGTRQTQNELLEGRMMRPWKMVASLPCMSQSGVSSSHSTASRNGASWLQPLVLRMLIFLLSYGPRTDQHGQESRWKLYLPILLSMENTS